MSITSFYFWVFLLISGLIYYLFPIKKYQWTVILTANVTFFLIVSGLIMIPYLLWGIIIAWGGGLLIQKAEKKYKGRILGITILLLLGELASLKYVELGKSICSFFANAVGREINFEIGKIIAPIGISYYMLSVIGYVIEVYWENILPEKNLFKFATFVTYFPQMTSGPITRYGEMGRQLFCEHRFEYKKVLFGIQRILWGLFKKIVIADRVSIFVSAVYDNYTGYMGTWVVVAVLLFALQLYADFSGCMDIICGASECFDINLPENFKSPFMAETVSEFWDRWHITMGKWFRDFLLYPLLKSDMNQKLRKRLKKCLGKKISKNIPTYLCMSVVWLSIGIWHGGSFKFIFASGILQGFYLIMGQIFAPVSKKLVVFFEINTEVYSWRLFRRFRTLFCLCTSWVFVRASGFMNGIYMIKNIFSAKNINILFDDSLYNLGLTEKDFGIVGVALLILMFVDHKKEKGIKIREEIYKQNIWAQWLIMLIAVFVVLILGIYGPGYDATAFIYENF